MKISDRKLIEPIVTTNPVTVHVLGICSALAVTTSVATALVMSASVIFVLSLSNTIISVIRRHIPSSIRLIIQITIIASLVIIVDLILQAYLFEVSKRLSVFVSLIVSNCIVLARAEVFAMKNPPLPSLLDGLGNGLGYAWILVLIGAVRELLAAGTLLGFTILPPATDGGWFTPLKFMALPPSAFFLLGLLIWAVRTWRVGQREAPPAVRAEDSP